MNTDYVTFFALALFSSSFMEKLLCTCVSRIFLICELFHSSFIEVAINMRFNDFLNMRFVVLKSYSLVIWTTCYVFMFEKNQQL